MEDQTQQTQENQNQASAPEDLEAIKAQLEEEKQARAAAMETLASRDTRIAALETALSEATSSSEAKTIDLETTAAELASTRGAKDQAVARYLGMAKALNPTIPEGIIVGESIQAIDESIEKGKAIVEAVKAAMAAEASAAKVPAGAPTRGGISTEGLSPREKIAAGIQQKGGTS